MTPPLFETVDLRVDYDRVEVLHRVSVAITQGECVGIIGPNGCGKSTLLHAMAGLKAPSGGRMLFKGSEITTTSARERLLLGIALVPQGRRIFSQMTVEENLLMGAYPWRQQARRRLSTVAPVLGDLRRRLHHMCGTLSGGAQQIVAIARALMSEPHLLLLDEPLLGLSASNRSLVLDMIRDLSSRGTTVAIVEHRIDSLNTVVQRNVVMQNGSITEFRDVIATIAGTESDDISENRS